MQQVSHTHDFRNPTGQRAAVLASSRKRHEKAAIRAALRKGEADLSHVLSDPPECLKDTLLVDIIGWPRHMGPRKVARVGRRAIGAGVNLAQPVGWAATRTRQWVIANAEL